MTEFFILILGSSNSGKSTFLSILGDPNTENPHIRSSTTIDLSTSKGDVKLTFIMPCDKIVKDIPINAVVILHANNNQSRLKKDLLPNIPVYNVYTKSDLYNYPESLSWPTICSANGDGVDTLLTRIASDAMEQDLIIAESSFPWKSPEWKSSRIYYLVMSMKMLHSHINGLQSQLDTLAAK